MTEEEWKQWATVRALSGFKKDTDQTRALITMALRMLRWAEEDAVMTVETRDGVLLSKLDIADLPGLRMHADGG